VPEFRSQTVSVAAPLSTALDTRRCSDTEVGIRHLSSPRGSKANDTGSAPISDWVASSWNGNALYPVCQHGLDEATVGYDAHARGRDSATLTFRHINVALVITPETFGSGSIAGGEADLRVSCLRVEAPALREDDVGLCGVATTDFIQGLQHPVAASSGDPVIRRLCDALATLNDTADDNNEIYEDALRLALVARLVGLQSQERRPAGRTAVDCLSKRRVAVLQKWRLKRVIDYVDSHLSEKITLSHLAHAAGLSRMYFAAQFRTTTGVRPHEYLVRRRIRRAEELLQGSNMTIADISLTVGFQTQAHFATVFKRLMGQTPYQWRRAAPARGIEIAADEVNQRRSALRQNI
jgi:AraC family transcriptional regulator